jgi:hypothetical protein
MTRMTTNNLPQTVRLSLAAALLATVLVGCDKPQQPDPTPTPTAPSKETPVPDVAAPASAPAPSPPPPTDPSAAPRPTAGNEPSLESMHVAIPSAKMSVPVELRYQIDGDVLAGQPVMLRLAAVPRVAGTRLQLTVKQTPGLQVASGPLQVQKVAATGVYRQTMAITRASSGPQSLRVLVTMDMPDGAGFGFYTVPLSGGNFPQKLESVKQR